MLVLGPYKDGGYQILSSIRNGLIANDISNSRIVTDFETPSKDSFDPSTYELSRSEYWIDNSDLLLFVFIAGLDGAGVAVELNYAIESDLMHRSIVAYNETEGYKLSLLIKGKVKRYSSLVTEIKYDTQDEVVRKAKGAVVSKLEILYEHLRRRASGEWERRKFS
ncbi:MAG: hypothetical protein ACRECH_11500 [Nitrososphaerales archaeon]